MKETGRVVGIPLVVYYGARDFGDQLVRGDDYHLLTHTSVIAWLVKPLFPKPRRLHSIFEIRERHTHRLLGGHLSFHLLQLSHIPSLSIPPRDPL